MAKRKTYTLDQLRAMQADEWYSVPEIAHRWHKQPAQVCRILAQCNAAPHRFECGGWIYWQFPGHAVYCAEEGQRVLFS